MKNKRKGDWIKGKNEHMDVFGFLKLISLNLNTYFYHINLKEAKEFLNPAFNNTFFPQILATYGCAAHSRVASARSWTNDWGGIWGGGSSFSTCWGNGTDWGGIMASWEGVVLNTAGSKVTNGSWGTG